MAVTKQQLLDVCAALARQEPRAVTRGFRPGHGLRTVKKAIAALDVKEPFDPAELCLALTITLCAYEPWDDLDHALLEPLFDALRVLARLGGKPKKLAKKIPEANVAIRHGDVSIRGDLFIRGALHVTGSLAVSGAIHNYGDDWSSGTLVVLGDVSAARMICLGPTAIGGTLALSQGLITAYYHDTTSTLVARRIEAPIWFDRGDIAKRIRGTLAIPRKLRFQSWIDKRLSTYFDGESRKVEWTDFDAAFFRAAVKSADHR